MQKLKEYFKVVDQIWETIELDYSELKEKNLNKDIFNDINSKRLINSFLYNYSKIQDKIGLKLFKDVLYQLNEIDNFSIPMIDTLKRLEKLKIIPSISDWERLREIRNILAHEYPSEDSERIEIIRIVIESYEHLKQLYEKLKQYSIDHGILDK